MSEKMDEKSCHDGLSICPHCGVRVYHMYRRDAQGKLQTKEED